jgi:YbgC/YbaW family acyl-CoA thioester hydrolase
MSLKFEYALKILEKHLDSFGHVNNATYLELYEEARWDFIEKNGFGLAHIQKCQQGPVILELNLRFKAELVNRENIVIVSQHLETVGSRLMLMSQKMLKEDGTIASEIELKIGLMDMRERRLIKASPEWLKAIGVE